ncbi:anthocyanidin 3-O-glucosyltransferase 2 [Dorcoceras hygrometricum]|uniref:Glycosyltransferase n=1 Tax=Dorcoceras hygrometricum TaxID=472368 RepID=A0A2Z7CRX9_9LAMI|nr:anthocyanidin 3-O-glucosyltransferase 2 [Dorcoceras hygrometricum]
MKKAELVFIPLPGVSHLASTVEAAKLLLQRDCRLSATFLIMRFPNDDIIEAYTKEISTPSLRIISIPEQDISPGSETYLFDLIESQVPSMRNVLSELLQKSSDRIAGIVLDLFCSRFVDVADELGIPSYIFFTSSASALGLFTHLTSLKFDHNLDLTQFENSEAELSVPCVSIKVPAKVLPAFSVRTGPLTERAFDCFKRFFKVKGFLINTFYELESYAIRSLSNGKLPKVYPIGPVLNLHHQIGSSEGRSDEDEIKKWLDIQPNSSVVFLCFGSRAGLEVPQLKEVASALERSGYRFLLSIRKPPPQGKFRPTDYEDFDGVLPEGFLERTKGRGKLIGWAPQMEVLSHAAVGGFVSHCGWNSTLESVWCGIPVATFPMYAEQQLNAFQLVKEYGMAEAIRVDYVKDDRMDSEAEVVGSEEIEVAIRRLMEAEGSGGVREKVRRMQKESRLALEEGGSSYNAQISFIEDVIKNVD